ncbi:FliH/SctL family protein [Leifsonia sp. NPDC058230]|uniref:FliH/SctL family protein n=1 Tax=Leifsonia sp. NPDC058230 TaxID=3346391 RepID=UPI0036D80431
MSTDVVFERVPLPVLAETEQSQAASETARSRGFAAGYADGLRAAALEQAAWADAAEAERVLESEAAAVRVAHVAATLRTAAVDLTECTVPVLAEAEQALLAAAFELAEAVIGSAQSDRLAAARAAVARVLDSEVAGEVGVVRLSPGDLEVLAPLVSDGEVRFVGDPALAPGDAIGELPDGWLDARIRTALDRAREALA